MTGGIGRGWETSSIENIQEIFKSAGAPNLTPWLSEQLHYAVSGIASHRAWYPGKNHGIGRGWKTSSIENIQEIFKSAGAPNLTTGLSEQLHYAISSIADHRAWNPGKNHGSGRGWKTSSIENIQEIFKSAGAPNLTTGLSEQLHYAISNIANHRAWNPGHSLR